MTNLPHSLSQLGTAPRFLVLSTSTAKPSREMQHLSIAKSNISMLLEIHHYVVKLFHIELMVDGRRDCRYIQKEEGVMTDLTTSIPLFGLYELLISYLFYKFLHAVFNCVLLYRCL
jgi:hypothetical protein